MNELLQQFFFFHRIQCAKALIRIYGIFFEHRKKKNEKKSTTCGKVENKVKKNYNKILFIGFHA